MKTTRTELALLLAITIAGFASRFANLGDVAVEHFDEGIYASNLWFPGEGYAYPDRHLYAPPLLPSLIEWSMSAFGTNSQHAPLMPGIILGSLTVPLLWLVTRRWFGAAPGIAAACLLALSDFHITMSRSALTDTPMVFFLLLGVWLIYEGVTEGRIGLAGLGGLATGLAWATKYNGWLGLAIAGSGTIAALVADRTFRPAESTKTTASKKSEKTTSNDRTPPSSMAVALVAACAAAVVVWYQVLSGLPNGYSEVSSNHSRYIVGFGGWIDSLVRHEAIRRHYAGVSTWLSGLIATVAAAVTLRAERSTWNSETKSDERTATDFVVHSGSVSGSTWNGEVSSSTILITAALSGAVVLSPIVVLLVWSVVALATLILRAVNRLRSGKSKDRCPDSTWLALWLCLAWFCGLTLATPLYRPYPRLLLPLQMIGVIGTSVAVVMLLSGQVLNPQRSADSENTKSTGRFTWLIPVFLLCAWRAYSNGAPAWQTRTELKEIAQRSAESAATDCQGEPSEIEGYDFVLYVYGEPGLLHHIPIVNDRAFVMPASNLDMARLGNDHAKVPVFVLAGPHALQSLEFQKQLASLDDRIEEVDVFPYRPSDFVLLDDVPPSKLADRRAQLVRLYRVQVN